MTTTTSKQPRSTNRPVRAVALTLAVAATALAGLTLGRGPDLAQADPGDTFVAIGSSQLVQSEDLAAIQVTLDTGTVTLNRDDPFSSCIGEGARWTEVLRGSPKPVRMAWTSRRHDDQALYETIAQAKTAAQAKRFAATLVSEGIRDCQRKPYKWDFHYGPTTTSRVGSGSATWALSYRGKQARPDGGVVVIRKGTNVGIIHVSGTWGPVDQTMESVAKVAVSRLR